jgi:hypothetical protein
MDRTIRNGGTRDRDAEPVTNPNNPLLIVLRLPVGCKAVGTGPASCGAYPRLEPDDGKLSCPVLRGGSGRDAAVLPDGETKAGSPCRNFADRQRNEG